jgi:hypothetical protein
MKHTCIQVFVILRCYPLKFITFRVGAMRQLFLILLEAPLVLNFLNII